MRPLDIVIDGERLELLANGSWTAPHAAELQALMDAARQAAPAKRAAVINLAGIQELDTFGAWLIEQARRHISAQGREVLLVGVTERYHGLLEELQHVNRSISPERPAVSMFQDRLEWIGRQSIQLGSDFVALLAILGAIGEALIRVLARPRTFRLTSAVHQLDRVAWQAVPIIALITFLIGGIIAQQGIFHFRKFGAEDYVVDLVGILVLREIGVLLVAIMVAGRSGSSYTAELGSMKMREEIDALRTMGLDPIEVLILPRVLALVCAMPILTFLGSMAALYGGGMVAWLYAGMSPEIFIARVKEAVSIDHFKVGMIKAPFMALVIGAVSCAEGFKVKGSSESLGIQTTASVVRSIFLVIVLDGLFAIFFASIGM
jgi:phospholipid/cholesterol/gamma-HCH transport system permease protein